MKSAIIILMLITCYDIFGQINIGPIEHVKTKKVEFEQADLDLLKSSTTLFVYHEHDREDLKLFKSTLNEVWDYTDLEFISYEEFAAKTYDENTSFFTIGRRHHIRASSTSVSTNTYIYLTLWMNHNNNKLTFCRMELYPSFPTYLKVDDYDSDSESLMMKYIYEESTLYNWNLVYLKNALQFINKKLTSSDEHWLFDSESHPSLSQLKNDTLYIPEYTLIKLSILKQDESERHSVKKLFKNYPYPYRIVSISELSKIISNSIEPSCYLSYIRSCTDKFVSVIDGKTGELLYSDYSPMSTNIKDKDLAKLSIAIK